MGVIHVSSTDNARYRRLFIFQSVNATEGTEKL